MPASESPCLGPLGGRLGFRQPSSVSSLRDGRVPAEAHSRVFCGLLFLALAFQAGELGVGLEPLIFVGEPLQLRDTLPMLNRHTWVWAQPFSCLSPSYRLHPAASVSVVTGFVSR